MHLRYQYDFIKSVGGLFKIFGNLLSLPDLLYRPRRKQLYIVLGADRPPQSSVPKLVLPIRSDDFVIEYVVNTVKSFIAFLPDQQTPASLLFRCDP